MPSANLCNHSPAKGHNIGGRSARNIARVTLLDRVRCSPLGDRYPHVQKGNEQVIQPFFFVNLFFSQLAADSE